MMPARTTVRLGDLCDLVSEQIDPNTVGERIYIGLEHVPSGRFTATSYGSATAVRSSKFEFRKGDILYGKLRPYLDKAIVADHDGLCTTELLVLRPKLGVEPRFLIGVLHSRNFIEHAVSGTTGSQHPRTSWHRVREFELPDFSIFERSQLTELTWKTHNSLVAAEVGIEIEGRLKQAAMRELFTHGLRGEARLETDIGRIPADWAVRRLGDVALLERGRFMHRPRNDPRFYGGKIPFVQTGDVVRSEGRMRQFSQTLNEEGAAISRVFPRGTLLITIAANIGYTGILEFGAAAPDSLIAITPTAQVGTEFLNYVLQTHQAEMDRLAPKGTQKNINIEFLKPWLIPVPPLDEQREIVAILDAIDRKIDLHKRKKAVLEELFKALLHKLMTGEIRVGDLDLSVLVPAPEATAA